MNALNLIRIVSLIVSAAALILAIVNLKKVKGNV